MAGRGPAPKPAHLRQRTNKKIGAVTLQASEALRGDEIPALINPDGRVWHPETLRDWEAAWRSPMAPQWLEMDARGIGKVALLWDNFYKNPIASELTEIRLQEARFGCSPQDRARLQWEVSRADAEAIKQDRRVASQQKRTGTHDPRQMLRAVK